MPSRGTPRQAIRIPDDLWERLGAAAEEAGTDRSALLRELAERYLAGPRDIEQERRERKHARRLVELRLVHDGFERQLAQTERLHEARDRQIRADVDAGVTVDQVAEALHITAAEVRAIIERDQPST